MNFNFKDSGFKDLLKSKQYLIISKTSNEILENDGYKKLFGNLKTIITNNAYSGSKIVVIRESLVAKFNIDSPDKINTFFSSHEFTYNHIIEIDENFNIIKAEREKLPTNTNEARKYFLEISKTDFVVFHLIETFINVFINGEEFSESIFLSKEDKETYIEKKDISKINEVFEEYQVRLTERHCYCKFFIPKSQILTLCPTCDTPSKKHEFVARFSHILNNKPEDKFRDDLRVFLKEKLKVTLVKEYLLENLRRLDIYLFDEYGEIYLVEVKWVGVSINPEGKKVSTQFKSKDINPAAIVQSLDYLEQLDKEKQNIVRAYLVVFDARKNDENDTGEGFTDKILNPTQKIHYRKFEKIKDFRVKNTHPS